MSADRQFDVGSFVRLQRTAGSTSRVAASDIAGQWRVWAGHAMNAALCRRLCKVGFLRFAATL